jgi:hypothetical protein
MSPICRSKEMIGRADHRTWRASLLHTDLPRGTLRCSCAEDGTSCAYTIQLNDDMRADAAVCGGADV